MSFVQFLNKFHFLLQLFLPLFFLLSFCMAFFCQTFSSLNLLLSFVQKLLSHFLLFFCLLLLIFQISLFFSLTPVSIISQTGSRHRSCNILNFFHHNRGDCVMCKLHFSYLIIIIIMFSVLRKETIKRLFCSQKNLSNKNQEVDNTKNILTTKNLHQYLNKPSTSTQKKIRNKMQRQWLVCLLLATMFYFSSEDIVPGTWFTDNLFFDYLDKYPYRLSQQYMREGKCSQKYTEMQKAHQKLN